MKNRSLNVSAIDKFKVNIMCKNRLQVLQKVISLIDVENGSRLLKCNWVELPEIKQGQFVIAAMIIPDNPLNRVGYITQIRKGVGQFGSDLVFMRLADGSLIVHENQGYWSLTKEQELLARSVFDDLPENEDYSFGYKCPQKIHEYGFIVDDSKSEATPVDGSFKITVTGRDSTEQKTFI